MPPISPRLSRLLSDLGPQRVRLGNDGRSDLAPPCLPTGACLPTGVGAVDHLLRGGFPCGQLCEVTGPISSGRTSLGLSLLARTTQGGECVAIVDCANSFDPRSARAAGVALERVLWIRPPLERKRHQTLRCVERLLETDGFPLVLLDLARISGTAQTHGNRVVPPPAPSASSWLRLARLAAGTGTALVVLSHERMTGSHAYLALEMQSARACFDRDEGNDNAPALLEHLETRAVLVRHRAAPTGAIASLRLGARAA